MITEFASMEEAKLLEMAQKEGVSKKAIIQRALSLYVTVRPEMLQGWTLWLRNSRLDLEKEVLLPPPGEG